MVAMPAEQAINADGRARMLNPPLIKARIESELKQSKFKDISSKRFAVLLPYNINRQGFIDDVARIFQEENAAVKPISGHSLGGVHVGNFVIFAKPEGRQISAGTKNEQLMIDNINQLLDGGSMNIKFNGGGRIFEVKDVQDAVGVGRETGMGRKADVHLTTARGTVPISLKMDNAERWESVDSWYPEMGGIQLLEDAEETKNIAVQQIGSIFQMRDSRSGAKKNIATRASKQQAEQVVFGSDINRIPQGAVIIKTFKGTDFTVTDDGSDIEINVTRIIDSVRALKKDEVWFLLTNSSTRTGSRIRPGIRAEAVTSRRAMRSGVVRI